MGRWNIGVVGLLVQTTLTISLGAWMTNAQNFSAGNEQGVLSACDFSNEQTTTIETTDIKYKYQFLLTASLSNVPFESALANPDSATFKSQAAAFEQEIVNNLWPLIQNPAPSTVVVALDAAVIQFRPSDQGLSTGLTLECVLSMDTNQFTASTLDSHVRAISSKSIAYPNFISRVSSSVSYCLREVILTQEGTITWPVTPVGTETGTQELCPFGTKYVGERSLGQRSCSRSPAAPGHAHWEPYVCIDCGQILQVDDALESIYNEIRRNSSIVLDGVRRAGALLNQVTDITEVGFKWVALILEHLTGLNLTGTELLDALLRLLSNLLQQDARTFLLAERQYSSSSRLVQSLAVVLKGVTLIGATEYVSIHPNVAASLVDLPQAEIQEQWLSFGSVVGAVANTPLNEGSVGLLTGRSLSLLPNCEAYVHVKIEGPVLTSTATVRTLFVLYHNAKLFQSVSTSESGTSPTIAGRVVSADIRASQSPELSVVTRFKPLDPSVTNVECQSWDTGFNDGHGDWSTPACYRDDTETSDRTKCLCNRLTAFTIFAEPGVGGPDDTNGVNGFVRAGAVICMLCLLAAIILYLVVKQLRYHRETQILGCLFFSLAAFYLLLVAGIDQSGTACFVFGALMHYCLLAAVGWVVVAWVHLYDLSRRKPWTIEWFMAKVSGPVWGIPFLFVVITVVVDPNHYVTPTQRCFLSSYPIYNLIVTLVVPVVFMLAAMAVAFGCTARNVILDSEAKPDLDPEGELNVGRRPSGLAKSWKLWRRYVLYLILVVLILLVIVFAVVMANATAGDADEYIFGFLAIAKGVFVVAAFCVYHQEVREAVMVRLGYTNGPDSRRFQPYWSTAKWQKSSNGRSVLPHAAASSSEDANGNAKRLYLDDTQGSGAQTSQGFDPNSIPLSSIEMQRMGINGAAGNTSNNGMVVQVDCHLEADAPV